MRRSRAFDALTAAVRRYNNAPKTLYAHKPAQICGFSIDKCRRVPYNTIRNKSIKNIFCNLFYSCSIFTAFISTGRESLALSARGAAACGVYMGTDGFFSSGAREDRSVCRVGDRPVGLPSLPQRVDGRAERSKRRPGVGTSRCGCVFSAVSPSLTTSNHLFPRQRLSCCAFKEPSRFSTTSPRGLLYFCRLRAGLIRPAAAAADSFSLSVPGASPVRGFPTSESV